MTGLAKKVKTWSTFATEARGAAHFFRLAPSLNMVLPLASHKDANMVSRFQYNLAAILAAGFKTAPNCWKYPGRMT